MLDQAAIEAEIIAFGAFRLTPANRSLVRNGVPVRLGGRAIELLIALVERAGHVVGKEELLDLVWPDAVVEESNLRVHIAALRRALGDSRGGSRFIINMPGRGYSFVADVQRVAGKSQAELTHPRDEAAPQAQAPSLLTEIFGRDEIIRRLVSRLPARRFVTITGTGGIGKTAVALAVADQLSGGYRDGILFVDLAPLNDPALVVAHLAARMGLPASDAFPLARVLAHLKNRNLLLILDNCEHLITAATEVAEAILQGSPEVHVLATSREVLRGAGEWVERLGPLRAPPLGDSLTAEVALSFPAVGLLVERIRACVGTFELTDELAPVAAEICFRLDGLPLALELAATRVGAFGLRGVLQRLDDRFRLLTKGRRSAAPRHQNLSAMIAWSYETLRKEEQLAWRRLSVFAGPFGADAAVALLSQGQPSESDILDVLDSLFEKSLITLDIQDGAATYRMLETLRHFAADKLVEAGECSATRRAHAEYFDRLCQQTSTSLIDTPREGWPQRYGRHVADIRAALAWAFGPDGDIDFGIGFAANSASFWFRLLLVPELKGHLERALAAAADRPSIAPDILIRLYIALAHAIFHSRGPSEEVRDALGKALAIARRQSDLSAQLQILWAIFGNDSTNGDLVQMTEATEALAKLRGIGQDDLVEPLYNRIAALGYHLIGDQRVAAGYVEAALNHPAVTRGISRDGVFVYDHETATNSHKARILWVQGRYVEAREIVRSTLVRAREIGQPFAFGYFLVFGACPVAIWSGEHGFARELVAEIGKVTSETPFNVWQMSADVYTRVLDYLAADGDAAQKLQVALLQDESLTRFQAQSLATFDPRLLRPECVSALRSGQVDWSTAEIMRAWGEAQLSQGGQRTRAEAERLFRKGLELADRQGAAAWQLRLSMSLARLISSNGSQAQARGFLEAKLDGIGARQMQADVEEAYALLQTLG